MTYANKKILPRNQELIPVSLKRKFAYKGTFMEEIISKSKIQEYFNYFKRENPLFADEALNQDRIDKWIQSLSGDSENGDINTDQVEAGRGGAAQSEDCETEEVEID